MRSVYSVVGLLLILSACSKSDDPSPAPTTLPQIVSIQSDNGSDYSFFYDSANRVSQIQYGDNAGGATISFAYAPSLVYTSIVTGTGSVTNDSLSIASDGAINYDHLGTLIKSGITYYAYTNGDVASGDFKGTLSGLAIETKTTYTYSNGNLVGDSNGNTYTYYDNPQGTVGYWDIMNYEQYGNQAHVIKTAQPLKSVTNASGQTVNFAYAYDSQHRLVTITETGSVTEQIGISYEH